MVEARSPRGGKKTYLDRLLWSTAKAFTDFRTKRRKIRIVIDIVFVLGWGCGAVWEGVEALRGASYGPPLMGSLICASFLIDLKRAWESS